MQSDYQAYQCQICNIFIAPQLFQKHTNQCNIKNQKSRIIFMNQQNKSITKSESRYIIEQRKQVKPIQVCKNCGQIIEIEKKKLHSNICEGRQDKCQFCSDSFHYTLINDHYNLCQKKISMQNIRNEQLFRQQNEVFPPRIHPRYFGRRMMMQENGIYQTNRYRRREEQPRFIMMDFDFLDEIQNSQRRVKKNEKNYEFKKKEFEEVTENNNLCTICCCQFIKNDDIRELNCNHLFHNECIKKWFDNKPTCPNCKQAHIKPNNKESKGRSNLFY